MLAATGRAKAPGGDTPSCGQTDRPPPAQARQPARHAQRTFDRRAAGRCQMRMSWGFATRPTNIAPKRCVLTVEKPV